MGPEEWRFGPGPLNLADAATRSQLECEAVPFCWLDGPEFLYQEEERWPIDLAWLQVKEEMRPVRVQHATSDQQKQDWEEVRLMPEEIPALVEMKGKYLELIRLAQQEAFPA